MWSADDSKNNKSGVTWRYQKPCSEFESILFFMNFSKLRVRMNNKIMHAIINFILGLKFYTIFMINLGVDVTTWKFIGEFLIQVTIHVDDGLMQRRVSRKFLIFFYILSIIFFFCLFPCVNELVYTFVLNSN